MELKKCVALGLEPSFGFGDRTGLATPGHVASMKEAGSGIQAIFPQQSIREMTRTNRTANEVMVDAMTAAEQAGWTGPIGSDADHLKTDADVDVTAAEGFTFFTIDPSDHVDQKADDYSEAEVSEKFETVKSDSPWVETYIGKTIELSTKTSFNLDEAVLKRAAVKYGKAIQYGINLANYIKSVCEGRGQDYEIELSVDETEQPTTLAEHYIIADQCLRSGMKLVSLAPRFIGDFEKGCRLQRRIGRVGKISARSREHCSNAGTLQTESAFRFGQAVNLLDVCPHHTRSFPCENSRDKLP